MLLHVTWTEFKQAVTTGSLPYRYIDKDTWYDVFAVDNPFEYQCIVAKDGGSDQIDFETNFKGTAFATVSQFDSDGAEIVRIKAARRGWSFWAVPIEITTSTIGGSLFCQTSDGVAIPWITCKIYDVNDVEITDPVNLTACVKAVIDFEPTFDYEIIGGALRINANSGDDVRLWIVGAPDIPANLGGSKDFASGVNLKFLAPDSSFEIDGRVTKALTYNATTHQGKMRIILKHPAGLQTNMELTVHIYRL